MKIIKEYVETHKDRFLEELFELIRIPSISSLSEAKEDMYKTAERNPEWLEAPQVAGIYSVSSCISDNFADYIQYWRHNGYWLFDRPEVIEEIEESEKIDLSGMTLFYYEAYEEEFEKTTGTW